jgi:hypothetical protein
MNTANQLSTGGHQLWLSAFLHFEVLPVPNMPKVVASLAVNSVHLEGWTCHGTSGLRFPRGRIIVAKNEV